MIVEPSPCWVGSLAVLVPTLYLLYVYGTWTHSTWSRLGIPGPKPVPFLGNIRDVKKKGFFGAIAEWCQKYGKVFGVYMMRDPVLMTTDLDIIKEVFIRDFTNFSTRGLVPRLSQYPSSASLPLVNGDRWKRLRQTMSPAFSPIRLKQMTDTISRCCQNLTHAVHKLTDDDMPMDTKRLFGAYTLDVIAGTGFGLDTHFLVESDNPLLKHVFSMTSKSKTTSVAEVLANIFPVLVPVLHTLGFRTTSKKEVEFVTHCIQNLVEERRRERAEGRVDLLQLLLDAEATEAEVRANPSAKRLTTAEVVAQGFVFFLAAHETTSSTLQYLTYLLAVNPDIQDKLYDEIVTAIGDTEPSYETLSNIRYLDCCIFEALRIFPIGSVIARKALKTLTIKGVTIPAGSVVAVPICGLMRDEDIFPNADKFIPERFEDEDHSVPTLVKEMVFGAGPRQCIGMRLALHEIRMVITFLVRKFKFVAVRETPEAFTFLAQSTLSVSAPDVPLVVGTEFRDRELSIHSAEVRGMQQIAHASTRTHLADKSTASM